MSETRVLQYMQQWSRDQKSEPTYALLKAGGNFKLRIDQRCRSALPPDFILDPKAYITEQGQRLEKSFTPEYPDEAIYFVQLLDKSDIVIKRVELNKARDKLKATNKTREQAEKAAREMAITLVYKEFSTMYAAEKAGLPTAKALGFLWKGSGEERYTIMNHVEGVPGRKLGSLLRRRFSGRIDEIMAAVADRYEHVIYRYQDVLRIDKTRWSIKDIIVQMNEATGAIHEVVPIDWEWARDYAPRRTSILTDRHDLNIIKHIRRGSE